MSWTPPSVDTIFSAIDLTWAPAEIRDTPHWRLRRGKGGGQRVSAATWTKGHAPNDTDIDDAIAGLADFGQPPLFMHRGHEPGLAERLAARGFRRVSPVAILAAPVERFQSPEPMAAIPCARVLARQREMWQAAGIGPARLDVMDRVTAPKSYLLARNEDRPVGVGFVAVAGDIAMLHALEIAPEARRKGAAARLTARAATWAREAGAATLAVLVEDDNRSAEALYRSLGMAPVAHYAYWRTD